MYWDNKLFSDFWLKTPPLPLSTTHLGHVWIELHRPVYCFHRRHLRCAQAPFGRYVWGKSEMVEQHWSVAGEKTLKGGKHPEFPQEHFLRDNNIYKIHTKKLMFVSKISVSSEDKPLHSLFISPFPDDLACGVDGLFVVGQTRTCLPFPRPPWSPACNFIVDFSLLTNFSTHFSL